MKTTGRFAGMIIPVAVIAAACGVTAPEDTIGSFEWSELPAPAAEASSFAKIGDDVVLLGDVNAPTACFEVTPDYQGAGAHGTMHIRVQNRNHDGCGDRAVTYRYEAFLRGMGGVTELRVLHEVEGVETREYIHDLTQP